MIQVTKISAHITHRNTQWIWTHNLQTSYLQRKLSTLHKSSDLTSWKPYNVLQCKQFLYWINYISFHLLQVQRCLHTWGTYTLSYIPVAMWLPRYTRYYIRDNTPSVGFMSICLLSWRPEQTFLRAKHVHCISMLCIQYSTNSKGFTLVNNYYIHLVTKHTDRHNILWRHTYKHKLGLSPWPLGNILK